MGSKFIVATIIATLVIGSHAFAGQWEQDATGWKYKNTDGSYSMGSEVVYVYTPFEELRYQWIDGNGDGIAEYYAFGSDGYMVTDRETDMGYADSSGAIHDEDGAAKIGKITPSNKGEWIDDGRYWRHQGFDGLETGDWEWIDGKCYYFGTHRDVQGLFMYTDIYYDRDMKMPVNENGAWVVNGQEVIEGSTLAQQLTTDFFSGTYISTKFEDDGGTMYSNHETLEIKQSYTSEGEQLYELVSKDSRYKGEPITRYATQTVDSNGTVYLSVPYGKITINGTELQETNDEGRTTFKRQ